MTARMPSISSHLITPRRVCARSSDRRAAALLEVVLSLSILLVAMTFVGGAFRNGSMYVDRAERIARATILTERILGEMASGLTVVGEKEMVGNYGDESMPDMCWRAAVSPTDQIPGLINIEIEIFMGAQDSKPEERETIMTTYAQQASFVPINMQRDFGMTQEQLDALTQAIPGGQAVFDPTSFDPRAIARLDMETLKGLLPILIQAFGGQAVAEHMGDITKALESGDTGALQGLLQQAGQQQQQPPQQPPPNSGGTKPPRTGNNPPPRTPPAPPKSPIGGGKR